VEAHPGAFATHRPLLHEALDLGKAMIVQEVGRGLDQNYMCREDIKVEVARKIHSFHVLHNW
jgi:hypothetical protein